MSKNLSDLVAIFKRPSAKAAELDLALSDARLALDEAEARKLRAERSYTAGLLDAGDAELQKLRSSREDAILGRDRAAALVSSLEARLTETRIAEEAAAFRAERNELDARAARIAERIKTDYPRLARELVNLLKDIGPTDRQIIAMNSRIATRNDGTPLIVDVQSRGLPQPRARMRPRPRYGAVRDWKTWMNLHRAGR